MSAPTSPETDRLASLPKPSPTPEGRIWLRDLPLPATVVEVIEKACRRRWFWQRGEHRRDLEKEAKLQWYFGGHNVAYLVCPEGHAVVALDYDTAEDFQHIVERLTVEERQALVYGYIFPWNEKHGVIPGLTSTGVPQPPTELPPVSVPTASPTPEGRVWLRDLPLPAEVVRLVEDYCKGCWFWERARRRLRVEQDLKLQYYFGGQNVYCLATPKGLAILQLGLQGEGGVHRLRDQLPMEERDQLRLLTVEAWNYEGRLPSCYEL